MSWTRLWVGGVALLVACAGTDPLVARPAVSTETLLLAQGRYQDGWRFMEAGDYPAAVGAFDEAVQADPRHGLAYLAKAEAQLSIDDDPEVVFPVLAQAVTLLPENPRAHARYAEILFRLGLNDEAIGQWQRALELRPEMGEARVQLANALSARGAHADAIAHLEVALRQAPRDVQVRLRLAELYAAHGRLDDAAVEAEAAAIAVGRSAPLFRRAAELYARANSPSDADRLRALADALDPPAEKRTYRPLQKARR